MRRIAYKVLRIKGGILRSSHIGPIEYAPGRWTKAPKNAGDPRLLLFVFNTKKAALAFVVVDVCAAALVVWKVAVRGVKRAPRLKPPADPPADQPSSSCGNNKCVRCMCYSWPRGKLMAREVKPLEQVA